MQTNKEKAVDQPVEQQVIRSCVVNPDSCANPNRTKQILNLALMRTAKDDVPCHATDATSAAHSITKSEESALQSGFPWPVESVTDLPESNFASKCEEWMRKNDGIAGPVISRSSTAVKAAENFSESAAKSTDQNSPPWNEIINYAEKNAREFERQDNEAAASGKSGILFSHGSRSSAKSKSSEKTPLIKESSPRREDPSCVESSSDDGSSSSRENNCGEKTFLSAVRQESNGVGSSSEDGTSPINPKYPRANAERALGTTGRKRKDRSPKVIMDDSIIPRFYIESPESEQEQEQDEPRSPVPQDITDPTWEVDVPASAGACQAVPVPITPSNETAGVSPSAPKKMKRKKCPRPSVRKRLCDPSLWKDNKAKADLNHGVEHETPRGVKRRARRMGLGCHDKCLICKKPKLSEEERKSTFDRFWALGLHDKQWDYISRHVECFLPVRRRTLPNNAKNTSRKYYLKNSHGKKVQVCKKTFLDTLDVNQCWVETALRKVENGSNISPDKRGRHQNRPAKTSSATKDSVKKHINSFPRVYAHYIRESSKREYLETGLSVTKMFKLYVEWAKEENVKTPASERQYRRIFNTEFNLGFFLPRKDQCATCNKWKTSTDHDRREQVEAYQRHLKSKKLVYDLKKKDKAEAETNSRLCVACFDLQKVLTCPRSETSVFFYRNKLSLYNLTVFDLHSKEGTCFMWNETEARRGGNEVSSSLLAFIEAKVATGITHFKFYSDSPTGQNKNRLVFSMYLHASQKFKINITHRFFEPGHSYSEVDSMHARIEIEASRKELMVPNDWFNLILNAKQTGEKYKIVHMGKDNIYDFDHLKKMKSWTLDSKKNKVNWCKIVEVSAYWGKAHELTIKYDLDEGTPSTITTLKTGQPVDLASYLPPKAYELGIPLSSKKATDLRWLCNTGAIPSSHHDFYEGLISSVGSDAADEANVIDAEHGEDDED